jgi:5-(carboxyamino)imidazole ribonucleotide synthase
LRVGILGGGQLGRMIALAAYPLDLRVRLFDPSADACGGQATELHVGEYDDLEALKRFADGLDVITYEFENVPVEAAARLAEFAPIYPPPASLEVAQDRLVEKSFFREHGVPTPDFVGVDSLEGLRQAVARFGFPVVLKTRRMGYDGKGQIVIKDAAEIEAAWRQLGPSQLIVEAFVAFDRELSILAVRAQDGSTAFYPLVENQHRAGILRVSRAPAPNSSEALRDRAEQFATRALRALDYVGVLAIEFFVVGDDLLANEMAPRVHNSGHWTIEGAETSQFENHLRAVAGLPLGSTEARGYSVMLNIIGDAPVTRSVLEIESAHLHLYGKGARSGRKLGHVTLRGDSFAELEPRLASLSSLLP